MSQPAWPWPDRDAEHLLVSGSQMADLENQLFASGLPVEALMEKAALAVARRLQEPDWWPQLQQRGALVLVGPGHNGGDGLVVARELHQAGVAVRIWSPFERHKPLTAAHLRHARWLGIPELEAPPNAADPAVWIDALFGIGQSRPPGDALETLLHQRQQQQPDRLIAIDGPTGLCADSGQRLGRVAACAALSLSIGLIKQGFLQDQALAWVGRLERIELGLPAALLQAFEPNQPVALWGRDLAGAPWPQPSAAASKYERGRLLVIAGSEAYRGASQLCLQGASASGVGSLRAALPQPVAEQLWSVQPHVVVSAALQAHPSGSLQLAGLNESALERLDAVVLGPGLGGTSATEAAAEASIWKLLQRFAGLLLLDADGLNRLAHLGAQPWLQGRHGPTWITPHAGEFARLFPELAHQPPLLAASAAAQACSDQQPCSVLLKGARTVIAAADGRRWQLGEACRAAARAGLGDVLAGYAGGLGARGGSNAALLATSALAHAQAGLAAERIRGRGGAEPMGVSQQLQSQEPNTNETA
ncbi:NAD(P)H-hydrate dehydratase [Vulcanococcus sp.]|uniref:NAD(P)H-hydrate dehydratase n=1 Tax=Vulcanococcus sp. TaxID=2856995 RepID=UPI0037D9AB8F